MKPVFKGIIACLAILALASCGGGVWAYQGLVAPLHGPVQPVSFKIESGQPAAQIAANLQTGGFIHSSLLMRAYLRLTHQSLKAGIYSLAKDGSSIQNIQPLLKGIVAERQVTIPEGLRLNEIAQLLERQGVLKTTDLLAVARYNPSVVALPDAYDLKADTFLEGFLFPDTYRFSADASATDVIQRMMTNYLTRTKDLSVNYDTLILASMVEREAKFDADRPLIASVFTNRLAAGMPLQSDVTVEYAAANARCPGDFTACTQSNWWTPVTSTSIDSPYNTYRQAGLPPRPICNPGLKSIEAAANPAKTDYLYFVADKDGHAHFAKTLAEHNQNVAKYLNQ